MKLYTLPAVIGLVFALQGGAYGTLTWETKSADLHPTLADKEAVAHYKYKNTGDKPVKISSVRASCGCTTAALAKDVVGPGETGEITATFTIGNRIGVQKKTITVVTDDQPDPTLLTLSATIPQLLEVQPTFLFWSVNDTLDAKTITVTVGKDFPVTKLNVTSTDKSIKTEVSGPGASDKAFKITVTPTESGRPINSVLKIEPDFPKEPAKTFYANLRVDARAKPTAEKPAETKPGAEKPTETKPATEKPSETKSSAN
jgi:DNA-binding XRE family transcriptional regulator